MRVFCATAVFVVCAFVGYGSSGTSSAQSQMTQAGIAIDETAQTRFVAVEIEHQRGTTFD
jgi:hypothetical protein